MNDTGKRILVADDEQLYALAIKYNLEASGYQVITVHDGRSAINKVAGMDLDLVLLDIKMPDMDGFEAYRQIREFSDVPVIMLTALANEKDKVFGLDSGADDYVTKPFGADELMARVRAALRRSRSSTSINQEESVIHIGSIRIDIASNRVYARGCEVNLTPIEYRLLCELAKQVGRVLVTEYLVDKVWGQTYEGDETLLWKSIHRLRKKIEPDWKNPVHILTRRGIGYYLAINEENNLL